MKQSGFTLVELLVVLAVLIITLAGGVVVWEKKVARAPTPTPVVSLTPAIKISPSPIPQTKMPWEDSVCGNGICERCEDRSECCNSPCTIDPISGNQMCPPPTCVGWCSKDCESVTQPKTCKADADCYNAQGNPIGICNVPCQDKAICQNGICVKPMMNLPGIQ